MTSARPDAVVELRQYTMRPGARDTLIELFDRELVETQEAVGMRVIGQFRDLDDPDRFVWLRGFADMTTRRRALQDFYGGSVWREHSRAANATMIDSDDVLLLRPARASSGFALDGERAPVGDEPDDGGLVAATICHVDPLLTDDVATFFETTLRAELEETGTTILGCFVTEPAVNTFPALPVREGENVVVWFTGFESVDDHAEHVEALDSSALLRELSRRLDGRPQQLRLSPTPRSLLRGRAGAAARSVVSSAAKNA